MNTNDMNLALIMEDAITNGTVESYKIAFDVLGNIAARQVIKGHDTTRVINAMRRLGHQAIMQGLSLDDLFE